MGGEFSCSPRAVLTLFWDMHADESAQPYFNETLGAGNAKTAALFIPKCTNLTVAERIEMWIKCGLIVQAGEEALKAKDRAALEGLRGQASGSAALEIERMIGMLSKGR